VLPTKPNSTQGAISLINLASEVPPLVDRTGLLFVIFLIIVNNRMKTLGIKFLKI